jgi:NADH-quinone oxidoreductase subunit M
MQLGKRLPFAAVTFVIAGVASMGLPGFSGFVAELQVLMGAWTVFPKMTILAGVGILIGVAYTLRAIQKGFYSDAPPKPADRDHPLEPISMPERFGAVMLIGASLVIGLFPGLLMNWIEPCFNSPLSMFARLLVKGGN